MSLYKMFAKVYKKLNVNAVTDASAHAMTVSEQKKFLSSFPEPKDDYERSFFKFKCFFKYCYFGKAWLLVIYNFGAMFLLPFMYQKLRKRGENKEKVKKSVDAVLENVRRLPNQDILPDEIINKYKNTVEVHEVKYDGAFLGKVAIEICEEVRKRYFFSFYYRLIVMYKLAQFEQYIYENNPKVIVFYSCEREFSGPLQTLLCEKQGVRYECYMHGDYLFELCFAFQRYSHYYTWDESYNEMFKALRCSFPTTVYVPAKLKEFALCTENQDCKYFATYYFSNETRSSAEAICKAFYVFKEHGLRCKVRPHPRFSDIKMLKELFCDFEIENTSITPLAQSIMDSVFIVGLVTTVLSQAYFSGKKIVIDDVSSPQFYDELENKCYIMLKRPHILLSTILQDVNNNTLDVGCRCRLD